MAGTTTEEDFINCVVNVYNLGFKIFDQTSAAEEIITSVLKNIKSDMIEEMNNAIWGLLIFSTTTVLRNHWLQSCKEIAQKHNFAMPTEEQLNQIL